MGQNIAPQHFVITLVMNKFVLKKRHSLYVFLLIFTGLVFTGFRRSLSQNDLIVLKDEPIPVSPTEFYIASIIDERDDRNAVAWLLPSMPAEGQSKIKLVDMEGGGFAAIKRFIAHNLPRNTALRPVSINLKKFRADESLGPNGRIKGHVSVIMSFNLLADSAGAIHLTDYKGNADYVRSEGPAQDIEPTLRHMLESGVKYLNTWMNRQAASNIKLAKAVKIGFTDYEEKPEGDSIYYSVKRPLKWDDFKSKIPSARYDAEVFPTIGYDEHTDIAAGVVNVRLAVKVCLPKSAAWVKYGVSNDYVLNHEQRHFDIAKIVAEHFKQKLRAQNFTVNNYDGIINFEYLDTFREMDSLQKQYDDETRHGMDEFAQQRWNERIDKELRGYGVTGH